MATKKVKRVKPLKFETFVQTMMCTRCREAGAQLRVTFRLKKVEIEYHCKRCWPDSLSHARERTRLFDIVKLLIDLTQSNLMATQTIFNRDPITSAAWAKRLREEALKPGLWSGPLLFGEQNVTRARKPAKKRPTRKAVKKWVKPATRRAR